MASLALPDAPGCSPGEASVSESSSSSSSSTQDTTGTTPEDPATQKTLSERLHFPTRQDMTIEPGHIAPPLSARGKVVLTLKESFTLFSTLGWAASAGYTQLTNGSPNYGTDSGAFGERLGTTALTNTSEDILSNALFAPLFHEDPRYYKLGRKHSIGKRAVYAATRTLVSKTDSGRTTPNFSLLAGNLAGSALTNAYYPPLNHGVVETAKTFGTSIGGSAIGFTLTEFLDDLLGAAHLRMLE